MGTFALTENTEKDAQTQLNAHYTESLFCVLYFLKQRMHGYTKTYVTQELALFISPSLAPMHTHLHAHSHLFSHSPLQRCTYINTHTHTRTHYDRLLQQILTPRYTGTDTPNMIRGLFRDFWLSVIHVEPKALRGGRVYVADPLTHTHASPSHPHFGRATACNNRSSWTNSNIITMYPCGPWP